MTSDPNLRETLRLKINALLEGSQEREEVAQWASAVMLEVEDGVTDSAAWKTLQELTGVDSMNGPDMYFDYEPSFHEWLNNLDSE